MTTLNFFMFKLYLFCMSLLYRQFFQIAIIISYIYFYFIVSLYLYLVQFCIKLFFPKFKLHCKARHYSVFKSCLSYTQTNYLLSFFIKKFYIILFSYWIWAANIFFQSRLNKNQARYLRNNWEFCDFFYFLP